MGKIIVAGIGPGSKEDITPAVLEAVRQADAIVGYKYYFQFIEPYVPEGCECIDTGMKKERERAELAFSLAQQDKTVVVISSGDAGIYGMAPLIYEMQNLPLGSGPETKNLMLGPGPEIKSEVEIVALPGISAFQKAASLLGAPIGHDLCVISLSDLMTPWEVIERRIKAAAMADFVTAVYNPKSHGRYWQLYRLQELFLQERSADTPVGYVRQAGREEQQVKVTTLGAFDPEDVDMFTVVLIGNSQSYIAGNKIITPRGYYREETEVQVKPGSQVGFVACDSYHSRLRYGVDSLYRCRGRGDPLRQGEGRHPEDDCHRCDDGDEWYPQGCASATWCRGEVLSLGSPCDRDDPRHANHPYPGWYPSRRRGASRCTLRVWQCPYGLDGTLRPDS